MNSRLFGPKRAVGFGALAMFEGKLYFTSPKILLMTVLSQGIGSLNPFQNLKPSLLQSLPQGASMCNKMRRKKLLLFHSSDAPYGQ